MTMTTDALGISPVQTSPDLVQKVEDAAAAVVSSATGVSSALVEHGVEHAEVEVAKKATSVLADFPHLHIDLLELAHKVVESSKEDFYKAEDKVKAVLAAAEAFVQHVEEKAKSVL